MAIILDTKSYSTIALAEIQDSIKLLRDTFSALLRANRLMIATLNSLIESLRHCLNMSTRF